MIDYRNLTPYEVISDMEEKRRELSELNSELSKEGFKNVFDSSSLIAMLGLVSSDIVVSCETCSNELQQLFDLYTI